MMMVCLERTTTGDEEKRINCRQEVESIGFSGRFDTKGKPKVTSRILAYKFSNVLNLLKK